MEQCCSKVRMVGALRKNYNKIYIRENELLNTHYHSLPYYVDNEKRYAIWFNGYDEWIIGLFSSLEEGKFTTGFFQNDEFVDCPTDTNDWQEYFDGEWNTNLNATLTEYSKYANDSPFE